MKHFIKQCETFGRGLYAVSDIDVGVLLFEAELLVLSEQDTKTVNTTDLQYYTFKYNETQDCIVLGDGEIFNHADTPNVAYRLIDFDGRKRMQFYTIAAVARHSQLFIDYTADTKVDTEMYVNKNLI